MNIRKRNIIFITVLGSEIVKKLAFEPYESMMRAIVWLLLLYLYTVYTYLLILNINRYTHYTFYNVYLAFASPLNLVSTNFKLSTICYLLINGILLCDYVRITTELVANTF